MTHKQIEEQVAKNEAHRHELLGLMTKVVSELPEQTLTSENDCPVSDEEQDKCYLTAFKVKNGVLYADLSYDYDSDRHLPVSELAVESLFDVMREMLEDL